MKFSEFFQNANPDISIVAENTKPALNMLE